MMYPATVDPMFVEWFVTRDMLSLKNGVCPMSAAVEASITLVGEYTRSVGYDAARGLNTVITTKERAIRSLITLSTS